MRVSAWENLCPDSVAFPGKTGRFQIKVVRNSHVRNIAPRNSPEKLQLPALCASLVCGGYGSSYDGGYYEGVAPFGRFVGRPATNILIGALLLAGLSAQGAMAATSILETT
jgi:hypothetical protein